LTTNVTNSGQLNPGGIGGAGLITVNGNYTQTATGILNIDIGGLAANQFDQLVVNGIVTLSGTLNVALINGFMPALGNSFQILTFTGRNGDFQFENGLQFGANRFNPQYNATSLTLVVVPANIGLVINRGALGANDHVDWGILGPDQTFVNNPFGIASVGGDALMVSEAPGQFVRIDEGTSWTGNFALGDHLLYTGTAFGGGQGPITIHFAAPVRGVGAQIEADFYGPFGARITAFDMGGNQLGSFTEVGNSVGTEDNSAIFIGVLSNAANIATIVYSLDFGTMNTTDFAINQLDLVTGPAAGEDGGPAGPIALPPIGPSLPAGGSGAAVSQGNLPPVVSGVASSATGAGSTAKGHDGTFDLFTLNAELGAAAAQDDSQGFSDASSSARVTPEGNPDQAATDQLFSSHSALDMVLS
jgi:hypothetical protein